MSYSTDCSVTRVNYFSNPDVYVYDKPTGQEAADNARAIEDNMVRLMRGKISKSQRKTDSQRPERF